MILFLLFCCLFSPTISWDPDIIKLTDFEIAAISAKCNRKPANELPKAEATNVSKKGAAPSGLYPFMAFVGKEDQFLCGAVFIAPRHLLTARDCLRETNGQGLSLHVGGVSYGGNNGQRAGQTDMRRLEIDSAIFDDQDWGTDTRDLAILQISRTLAETVAPVIDFACLPDMDASFPTSAVVVGWGRMEQRSPPKHLQHAPIGLKSANPDGYFLGIITVPGEERLRSEHNDIRCEFPNLGLNSSIGNAVVSYSTTNGHYVLHGLLLGTSWTGRSGKTVSDGLKIAYFHADLCHRLRLCAPGINRASTIPKLKMLNGYSKNDGGSIAGYGFAGGFGEDRFTGDGRYCHMETTGNVKLENKTEVRKLVWYNAAGGYVNIDGSVNESDIISFDLGNQWKLESHKWYNQPKHPQLSLKVCEKTQKSGHREICPKGLLFCWRNGFNNKGDAPKADNEYIQALCNPVASDKQFWNGMLISFNDSMGFHEEDPPKFHLSFMHTKSEQVIEVQELPDHCWHFHFIKWHESMKKYNFGIYAKENPSFLPYLELDKDGDPSYPNKLDKMTMKIVGSENCSLLATLESEYGTPQYYKWVPAKMGGCGNEYGLNELNCSESSSKEYSRTVSNWDSKKDVMTNEQITEEEKTTDDVTRAVENVVEKNVKQMVDETTASLDVSIEASITAAFPGFDTSVSSKVAASMAEKWSTKITNSMTNSLKTAASKQITNKLQTVKTLKVISETIDEKYNEISTHVAQGRISNSTIPPRTYQETCQQQRVAYGIDRVQGGTNKKFYNESFGRNIHPKRDDRFT